MIQCGSEIGGYHKGVKNWITATKMSSSQVVRVNFVAGYGGAHCVAAMTVEEIILICVGGKSTVNTKLAR